MTTDFDSAIEVLRTADVIAVLDEDGNREIEFAKSTLRSIIASKARELAVIGQKIPRPDQDGYKVFLAMDGSKGLSRLQDGQVRAGELDRKTALREAL